MTDVFRIRDAFTVLKTQEAQKDEGKSLPLSDFQPSSSLCPVLLPHFLTGIAEMPALP